VTVGDSRWIIILLLIIFFLLFIFYTYNAQTLSNDYELEAPAFAF